MISPTGLVLEFGVASGSSINFIAKQLPDRLVYGFDSFEGLPEDWRWTEGLHQPKGTFACRVPANLLPNVHIVKGLFQDTLPRFMEWARSSERIAFVHIDCDLYSSTKYVLDMLGKDGWLDGAIVVFDELCNIPAYDEHEGRALAEFADRREYYIDNLGQQHGQGGAFRFIKVWTT